jgi:hypothetical protein
MDHYFIAFYVMFGIGYATGVYADDENSVSTIVGFMAFVFIWPLVVGYETAMRQKE